MVVMTQEWVKKKKKKKRINYGGVQTRNCGWLMVRTCMESRGVFAFGGVWCKEYPLSKYITSDVNIVTAINYRKDE